MKRSFESENTQVLKVRKQNNVRKTTLLNGAEWSAALIEFVRSIGSESTFCHHSFWLAKVVHWSLQSSPRRSTIQRIQRSPRMAAGYPLDSKSRERLNAVTVSTRNLPLGLKHGVVSTELSQLSPEPFGKTSRFGSNWWLDVSISFDWGFKQVPRVHKSKDLILLVRTCCTRLTGAN